ncbi:MAG: hypothetical protein ABSG91_25030 [Syntrophobacteraceae bacterium]
MNLIYDSFGSHKTPVSFFQRLRDGGVQVLEFDPVNPFKVLSGKKYALFHRDRRKILVVDGAIAFTGGVNISGVYSGSSARRSGGGKKEEPWRDTHVRIEGPAALRLQWLFMKIRESKRDRHFPVGTISPV